MNDTVDYQIFFFFASPNEYTLLITHWCLDWEVKKKCFQSLWMFPYDETLYTWQDTSVGFKLLFTQQVSLYFCEITAGNVINTFLVDDVLLQTSTVNRTDPNYVPTVSCCIWHSDTQQSSSSTDEDQCNYSCSVNMMSRHTWLLKGVRDATLISFAYVAPTIDNEGTDCTPFPILGATLLAKCRWTHPKCT